MSEMNKSLLQKEFSEADLQRIRNLATRKFADSTKTQIGYKKKKEIHKEGDIFTENDREYTIKNGIKTTYSKLDVVKKSLQLPILCPHCSQPMKHYLDKKFYFIRKMCFNCVTDYETKLRLEGKFEEYARNIIKNNASAFIKDLEQELQSFMDSGLKTFITEQGDMEDWQSNSDKIERMKKELQEYIDSIKAILK